MFRRPSVQRIPTEAGRAVQETSQSEPSINEQIERSEIE